MMNYEFMHPRDQLVETMNRIYHNHMTTLSGGNLSILDDNSDIWITPSGVDKGNLQPGDISCVKPDGTVLCPHPPSIELPFHRAIYEKRPDLRGVVHAHPPALTTYSVLRQAPDTKVIPQAYQMCGPVGIAKYALPGTEVLGANIAGTFSEGYDAVILENHGAATGGESLLDAFLRLETLDFCARTLIQAQRLGKVKLLTDRQVDLFESSNSHLPEFIHEKIGSDELMLRKQVVEIVRRACQRYLMNSSEGVVSARLAGNTFLITPDIVDRRVIKEQDLVLVRDGAREKGKYPDRTVKLHQEIYARHSGIKCVMTAQSPNIMAYAISDRNFDSKRSIPETFLLLSEVSKVPFEFLYQQPEEAAKTVSVKSPVTLVENACVLVVGESVFRAFNRLEVLEYSAMSLLNAAAIGAPVSISDADIQDLVNLH